jgi:hypothetical protein
VNRRLLREDAGLAIDVNVLRVSALKSLENDRKYMMPNNAINTDSKKRRAFVAPLFSAGYGER